ncbi:glycosyltransferase family 4 protein [Seonamhaeicola sp. MEBiC1930]|uniref:glycosyltransferase family 4 protein n=1 Tax=Seonamhaeicola sp. MEBiC01930 TaxID=2976768 RepID=UPI00324CD2A5
MDRFFIAFNSSCMNTGYQIDWFFPKSENIDLYNEVKFYTDENSTVEQLFLNHINKTDISYDIIITHFVEFYIPFFKKLRENNDCKVYAVDHMSRPIDGFSVKKRFKRKAKYLINSKYIDKIVAVSKYIKQQNLQDYGKGLRNKIEVIYNGIKTDLYQVKIPVNIEEKEQFRFIVVSHLVYEKGIHDLILALSMLEEFTLKRIKVDVYGEGIYKSTLEDLRNIHNLADVIEFKGSVPNLHKHYKDYDYMIQPTYMEAFSLSILESLCCNIPVITTKVGGNIEIIKNGVNGFLFNVKDVEALKKIIQDICNGHMSINNSKINEEIRHSFSLDNMVNNYLKLL